MDYYLRCSLNSLNDDSIHLGIFQWNVIVLWAKWYVELPKDSFNNFNGLITTFITNFELLVYYETDTNLLTSPKKFVSSHISNHIHEWIHYHRLSKTFILDSLLVERFFKYLLPDITKDVSKGGIITKEKSVASTQYLGFVYTQLGILYQNITNAPWTSHISPPPTSKESHVADSMIDFFGQ